MNNPNIEIYTDAGTLYLNTSAITVKSNNLIIDDKGQLLSKFKLKPIVMHDYHIQLADDRTIFIKKDTEITTRWGKLRIPCN